MAAPKKLTMTVESTTVVRITADEIKNRIFDMVTGLQGLNLPANQIQNLDIKMGLMDEDDNPIEFSSVQIIMRPKSSTQETETP